jgi:hypothetical protein
MSCFSADYYTLMMPHWPAPQPALIVRHIYFLLLPLKTALLPLALLYDIS